MAMTPVLLGCYRPLSALMQAFFLVLASDPFLCLPLAADCGRLPSCGCGLQNTLSRHDQNDSMGKHSCCHSMQSTFLFACASLSPPTTSLFPIIHPWAHRQWFLGVQGIPLQMVKCPQLRLLLLCTTKVVKYNDWFTYEKSAFSIERRGISAKSQRRFGCVASPVPALPVLRYHQGLICQQLPRFT